MSGGAAPVVLAGPTGAGKTTLAGRLVDGPGRYVFSVSATTRTPRDGERDGIDYHFVDADTFQTLVDAGDLVEWAEVHGRLYGTPREEVESAAQRGEHVVLDIDVQGARQIRTRVPDTTLIFVLPPNVDIMMARLEGRGTEAPAEIARRLRSAQAELRAVSDFDHVVVNDDVDQCVAAIRNIVEQGTGEVPERHVQDAEAYRFEIGRVLDEQYGDYLNIQ